jgi:hypothetical protein
MYSEFCTQNGMTSPPDQLLSAVHASKDTQAIDEKRQAEPTNERRECGPVQLPFPASILYLTQSTTPIKNSFIAVAGEFDLCRVLSETHVADEYRKEGRFRHRGGFRNRNGLA